MHGHNMVLINVVKCVVSVVFVLLVVVFILFAKIVSVLKHALSKIGKIIWLGWIRSTGDDAHETVNEYPTIKKTGTYKQINGKWVWIPPEQKH